MSDQIASLYRPLLLADGVHAAAARTPHKVALRCGDAELSYAELDRRVRYVTARALAALALQPGDRVAVLAANCLEYPELVLGLSDAGAIVATLNPRANSSELADACNDCGARVLFAHVSLRAVVQAARCRTVEQVVFIGAHGADGYDSWRESHEGGVIAARTPALAETQPFTLVYSSGTTGKPKGILISHRSRVLTFHAMAMEYGCYGPDDRFLSLAPMAHGAGLAFTMATLYFGGYVELVGKFEPAQVIEKLVQEPFTGIFMVPTHFQAIFALDAALLARHRHAARTLRAIISNAAALPQALKEKIVAFWGEGLLHETYGSTEAGIVTNIRPQDQLRRIQSVGRPFATNLVRLLDDHGQEVATGEVGELYSRSSYLFDGYWNNREDTAACIRDGWVSAGDLARCDADGYYYIVDRKKDMVISGGINIFPREIEEVLHRHPAVLEAAVIGIPDAHWGERLRAFVVRAAAASTSEEELLAYCKENLSGYKVPRELRFIETLPRNVGGKVLKKELRALA
ncbi:MAG: AMP-binding protein [Steroidobacteraceae bacterium]